MILDLLSCKHNTTTRSKVSYITCIQSNVVRNMVRNRPHAEGKRVPVSSTPYAYHVISYHTRTSPRTPTATHAPISAVRMHGDSCPPASATTSPQGSTIIEWPYEVRLLLCRPTFSVQSTMPNVQTQNVERGRSTTCSNTIFFRQQKDA